MAVVYILYSASLDFFYIGSCRDMNERLKQHINGKFEGSFTKRASDWTDFLVIDNLGYNQARQIEAHIKKMKSRKYIKNLKSYHEMRKNLIEKYGAGSSR